MMLPVTILGCKNLRWAEEYMRTKGLKFPPIDYTQADTQVMSIFKDEQDPTCPIVVYFPRIKNDAYSTSFRSGRMRKERLLQHDELHLQCCTNS